VSTGGHTPGMAPRPILVLNLTLVLFVSACGGGTATTTTTAETTTTTQSTTATAAETTTTAQETTTTTEAGLLEAANFAVPFRMRRGDVPLSKGPNTEVFVAFAGGNEKYLVFTTYGPQSTQEWLDLLAGLDVETSGPFEVEVGGRAGTGVDARADSFVGLLSFPASLALGVGWGLSGGYTTRFYLVDVDDQTVAILAEAEHGEFERWVESIEGVLETLEWNPET
jgi:hypothetical protein